MIINNGIENDRKRNKKLISKAIKVKARPNTGKINTIGNNSSNLRPNIFKNVYPAKNAKRLTFKKLGEPNMKNTKNDPKKKIDQKNNKQKNNENLNIDLDNLPKRLDIFGNEIRKNGKQKVTFIDKISKNNIATSINVKSFKQYNKTEIILNDNKQSYCCLLI